ncbi:MAG: acyl-CoA dehydrogenase, partial [Acidimicrobiales bacterium]|nr:acyl-CoA dehydrogenase [Acidimicrobiales bacterium]
TVPRALLDAAEEELQAAWKEFAAQGWLGIHVPEQDGGQGFGLPELAVVLEQAGQSCFPGPLLPTVLLAALAVEGGTPTQRAELLPGLVDGSAPAAVAFATGGLEIASRRADGGLELRGEISPVLGAQVARTALVGAGDDTGDVWCVLDLSADPVTVERLDSLDPTRRVARLRIEGTVVVPEGRQLGAVSQSRVRRLASVLAAAEVAGGARWCLETASEYAKVRRQFGRPIGQFQAVKHRLADMLVRSEQMEAVAWDAARAVGADDEQAALASATAAALVTEGGVRAAKDCIQLLGGIGFTWEHDAHLYLKRAVATRQLFGGSDDFVDEVVELARAGVRRALVTDLPPEATGVRDEVRAVVGDIAAAGDQRRAIVDAGLVSPHWPKPFGRDADPVQQLVIDEEMAAAGVLRPHIGVGAWALPVIISFGTEAQRERWVRPTLLGEITWCQLFSEPGAGSDLASLTTRAVRGDGGWLLTGQKVWTSLARQAQWGICLARTDPDVPKHDGITYFIVDMTTPGLDIRPLRELTGEAMFNEVFLDEVFVPDDCVIGAAGEGWKIARATLANERVSMSSGSSFGIGVESLLRLAERRHEELSSDAFHRVGELLVEAQSISLLAQRSTLRTLAGADPAAITSVRKLLGVEHEQRVQEQGLDFLGPDGVALDSDRARRWAHGFLVTRCLTIAGGTSEIQRNLIAERILGQPREPEPSTSA